MKTNSFIIKEKVQSFSPTTVYICDNCKKEASDNGEPMYGGSHFSGWYHLSQTNGSTQLEELQKVKNWDFCCKKCLQEFVQNNTLTIE